jgi:putative nucleotidyltransferase-like protein
VASNDLNVHRDAGGQGFSPTIEAVQGAQTVRLDLAAYEAVQALQAEGIPSVVLRGPAIARWLYPDGRRAYTDVDLLIPPGRAERARLVVATLGYVCISLPTSARNVDPHDSIWLRDTDGARLELHRSLVGIGADDAALWDRLSVEIEPLDLAMGDRTLPVLRPHARILVVALHAAAHGPWMPWPARDLELALAALSRSDLKETARLARQLDAVRAFAAGLRQTGAGAVLADNLALPTDRSVGIELRKAGAPAMALELESLSRLPGGRPRLLYVLREVFPPPGYMRVRYAMARRGRGGLSLTYLGRPLSLLVRLAPALVALRRATRRASIPAERG